MVSYQVQGVDRTGGHLGHNTHRSSNVLISCHSPRVRAHIQCKTCSRRRPTHSLQSSALTHYYKPYKRDGPKCHSPNKISAVQVHLTDFSPLFPNIHSRLVQAVVSKSIYHCPSRTP